MKEVQPKEEDMILNFGFGGIGAEAFDVEERKRKIELYTKRFEERGVEFTKGYLAGLYGRKPVWFLKFQKHMRCEMGPMGAQEAAEKFLERQGVDPLSCGAEFFNNAK